MAVIINPARVALGMNSKVAVRDRAASTRAPVKSPPSCVFTFDALLTAVRVKEPAVGMDLTKEPTMLQAPSAIISWVASKVFPFAEKRITFSNLEIFGNENKIVRFFCGWSICKKALTRHITFVGIKPNTNVVMNVPNPSPYLRCPYY